LLIFKFKQSIYEQNDNGVILLLQLNDKIKAIEAIYNHFQSKSLAELASSIRQLFGSEDEEAVLLSTIHRAKGMESERVYIAEPLTLPLLWESQKQWQEQQEQNLLYVALSRSTKDLFLIGDAFWFDDDLPSHSNLRSAEKTTFDLNGDRLPESESRSFLVEKRIVTASNEELEQYAKLIRLEQGKRVELSLKSLF
jgi:DNA helicase II / ATP-dependent DNA helicase PcrA